jgi:transcriptional regulator with XRE-family HTH domain
MAAGDPKPAELVALGRAVRELRARRGISQETLAHRSYLHRNYVGAIERGEINPTFRILLKLFIFLGLFGLADRLGVFVSVLVLVVGLIAWLSGHWLYAFREHEYAGPLVERIFFQVLPRRVDPTRGWGFPVHHTHTVHHHHHAPPLQRLAGSRRGLPLPAMLLGVLPARPPAPGRLQRPPRHSSPHRGLHPRTSRSVRRAQLHVSLSRLPRRENSRFSGRSVSSRTWGDEGSRRRASDHCIAQGVDVERRLLGCLGRAREDDVGDPFDLIRASQWRAAGFRITRSEGQPRAPCRRTVRPLLIDCVQDVNDGPRARFRCAGPRPEGIHPAYRIDIRIRRIDLDRRVPRTVSVTDAVGRSIAVDIRIRRIDLAAGVGSRAVVRAGLAAGVRAAGPRVSPVVAYIAPAVVAASASDASASANIIVGVAGIAQLAARDLGMRARRRDGVQAHHETERRHQQHEPRPQAPARPAKDIHRILPRFWIDDGKVVPQEYDV